MNVGDLQRLADDLFKSYGGKRTRLSLLLVDLAERLENPTPGRNYKVRAAIEDDYYTLTAHFGCSHADAINGTIVSGAGGCAPTT